MATIHTENPTRESAETETVLEIPQAIDVKTNIFIIDDEPIASQVIELYLSQAGYENLHVFNQSVEAVEILSIVNADLILTDVNMPELGGKYLTKLVRKYPHLENTPVMVITSDESETTRNHLMANGVFNILNKPVKQKELLVAVRKAIEMRKRMLECDIRTVEELEDGAKHQRLEMEKTLRMMFNR